MFLVAVHIVAARLGNRLRTDVLQGKAKWNNLFDELSHRVFQNMLKTFRSHTSRIVWRMQLRLPIEFLVLEHIQVNVLDHPNLHSCQQISRRKI